MMTPEALARQFQRDIEQGSIDAIRALTEGLARALPGLVAQAIAAAERVAALRAAGQNAAAAVFVAQRSRAIAQQVEAEVRRLVPLVTPAVQSGQQAAITAGLEAARVLTEASLPAGLTLDTVGRLTTPWQTAPLPAVQALIGATGPGSPLDRLLHQIAPDTGRRVREALTSGMLAGKGTRATARTLRREVGLPAQRAELVSRTETLRAYRAASVAAYAANSDIVKKFKRLATKSGRTCAGCLSLDGQEQDTSELLAIHPADRCAVVPVTATFRELGIPIDEAPRPVRETGADWLARQPLAVQERVLGKGGAALYRQGTPLSAFVRVRHDPTWGPTLERVPNRELAA